MLNPLPHPVSRHRSPSRQRDGLARLLPGWRWGLGVLTAMLVAALLLAAHHPASAAAKRPKKEKTAPAATGDTHAAATAPADETKPGDPTQRQDRKERSRRAKPDKKAAGDAKASNRILDFPVPVGRDAKGLHYPEYTEDDRLQMILHIKRAHRVDDETVELSAAKLATYTDEGGDDMGIDIASALYNLRTRILFSEEPVTIRRRDFEVTGAHFTFDTQTKKGDFVGPVRMLVYNSPRQLPKSDAARETPPDSPAPAGKEILPLAP